MERRLFLLVCLFIPVALYAQPKTFTIRPSQAVATVQPTMYGVFFEDINFGADGGIYAELIKNRSFEFFRPLMGWKVEQKPFREGAVTVLNRQETNAANPRFLRVKLDNAREGALSLVNEGFRGMGLKKGLRYDLSFTCRTAQPGIKIIASLLNESNQPIGSAELLPQVSGDEWKKISVSFTSSETAAKGQFKMAITGDGIIDLDMISLFPADTWKNRPGGLRADMVQMLADMKPGFVRFPGGCVVEGFNLSQRYQWKNTVGPVEERPLLINRWNFEFPHRAAPDYFQSFGLGFFEYFQICEDIGAEPLPILNCGMACQFNSAELVPLSDMQPYVQDALDLVEFANGPADSKWGKVRADMGHPQPFHLKMIGVGNENWGPQYLERLALFQKALNETYPEIKIIASSGTDPAGERFDYLNTRLRQMKVDFVDEHYYRPPQFFLSNASRYDNYPRNGSKVFAGEYAAHAEGSGPVRNNWRAAIAEAAFLTGLERNADVVQMASYAPLFGHVDAWQWAPDLIWVDNLNVAGSPSYQVQKLFSIHKGNTVVPLLMDGKAVAGQDSLYATAVVDLASKELIIKMVNTLSAAQSVTLAIEGPKRIAGSAKWIQMQNDDLAAVNTTTDPKTIVPAETVLRLQGKRPVVKLPAYSFNILRVKLL